MRGPGARTAATGLSRLARLREIDRLEAAEAWYLAAWWHPLAHERLGRLYEEMNRSDEAAKAYRRFVQGWKDADGSLQDKVDRARRRLQALNEEAFDG